MQKRFKERADQKQGEKEEENKKIKTGRTRRNGSSHSLGREKLAGPKGQPKGHSRADKQLDLIVERPGVQVSKERINKS